MKKKTIVFGLITMLLPFFLMAQTKDIVETVTVGTGTDANYLVPFVMNADYSMSQQIYPASEINQPGTISTIGFYLNAGGSFTMNDVKIYLKHTTKTSFTGNRDYVQMSSDDKVYEGQLKANSNGWVTVTLNTPFVYNGTDNLLVCCYDPNSSYLSYSYTWRYTSTTNNSVIYFNRNGSDGLNPEGSSMPIDGNRRQYFANLQLGYSELPSCTTPTDLQVSNIGTNSVDLSWNIDEGTNWLLQYKLNSASTWNEVAVSLADLDNGIYHLTGLSASATYNWQVARVCGENEQSTFAQGTDFTTEEICPGPTGLACTATTDVTATLRWDVNEDDYWYLQYIENGASSWNQKYIFPNDLTDGTYLLTGLNPSTTYSWKLSTFCNDGNDLSFETLGNNFTTACQYIADLPWTENFNDLNTNGQIPDCWDNSESSFQGNPTWRWCLSTSNAYNQSYGSSVGKGIDNSNCVRFNSFNTTANGYDYLKTRAIMLPAGKTARLVFWYKNPAGGDFSVYISTDGGQTKTALATGLTGQSAWTEKEISLEAYQGQDVVICFKGTSNWGNGDANIYLDDVTITTAVTLKKEIAGYGDSQNAGYHLIASPMETEITPTNVNGFVTNDYDLYYFDQTQNFEWITYKEGENAANAGFNLVSGKGYLYASKTNTTLTFIGEPYSGNGQVTLRKDDNAQWAGWNLVGNPYAQTAYITKPFYRLNPQGSALMSETSTGAINAMEGVFVMADSNNESLTFSTTEPSEQVSALTMEVTHDRSSALDRAIISFGEGCTLPKFMLNPNHTKLYIPQEGKDYAIASVGGDAKFCVSTEVPVNFKAEKNGSYTLRFSNENVEFSLLHLIDNMTGADIDLLQQPYYTFEAKTTDYVSRFRLVFSTDEPSAIPAFAYINNGNIIINEADAHGASIQVVDVMGHVVLSGDAMNRVSTSGMAPGVYVLRLISSGDVKAQKIVVK